MFDHLAVTSLALKAKKNKKVWQPAGNNILTINLHAYE